VSSRIWGSWPDIYYSLTLTLLLLWGGLSDGRTGLSFVKAAGPSQRILSWVRVTWDSRPYFAVSYLRFPFSSSLSFSLMLRPTVSRPVCPGTKHPSGTYDQIFISLWQLRFCFCGAPSLTRGWVCRVLGSVKSNKSTVRIYKIYILHVSHCKSIYTIYTTPLSVRARYSRLCPTSSSFRYHSSLDTWTVACLTVA
jgi:hypothetical protein